LGYNEKRGIKEMKKNIYLNYYPREAMDYRLSVIKRTGFDGVFLMYDDSNEFGDMVNKVGKMGLEIETFHLPYDICNHLWLDDDLGRQYVEDLIRGVRAAAYYGVKTVIMHTMSKDSPDYNELGITRIREILKVCVELNVDLALENVRDYHYTDFVFNRIKHPNLKMCLDFGHTNAFGYKFKDLDLTNYKGLITCLHIHDNHGHGDEHLIPFTGEIDYKSVVAKLKEINYTGPLTSEAHLRLPNIDPRKVTMTDEEFIKTVYKALLVIESYFGENNE
jgi:sugar phosphate isomerase/epimerase